MTDPATTDDAIRHVAAASLLRESITRRGYLRVGESALARTEQPGLETAIQRAGQSAMVNPHVPIAWPHWPPGIVPKIRAALQKATRRLLAWYITPIVAQQNDHNYDVILALQQAEHANRHLSERLAALERANQHLSERVAVLSRERVTSRSGVAGAGTGSDKSAMTPTA